MKEDPKKRHITVGVAGHVDHGKTSLVRTLTGIDTDRLEEEKRRGLSIESGVAPFHCASGLSVALVDVPGHTDFLKNTIRGLSCVDIAILPVAADVGVMPRPGSTSRFFPFLGLKPGSMVSARRNEGKLVRPKDGRYMPSDCLEAIREKVRGVIATNQDK
jgi:selenocysteine-specific elongation factor